MALLDVSATIPELMLLAVGAIFLFVGVFMTFYRFAKGEKTNILYIDDIFLWVGVVMIVVSLVMVFG